MNEQTLENIAGAETNYADLMSNRSFDWRGVTFTLAPLTIGQLIWAQTHDSKLRGLAQLQIVLVDITGCDVDWTEIVIDDRTYKRPSMSWLLEQIPGLTNALIDEAANMAGLTEAARVKLDFM